MVQGKRAPARAGRRTRREAELEARLQEAEDTLRAIRGGDVDAIVVYGPQGERIFTLRGAEHSYRVLVEAMSEGAATVSSEGTILYCNTSFAAMVERTVDAVMGTGISSHVAPGFGATVDELLRRGRHGATKGELGLRAKSGRVVPVLLSVNAMEVEGQNLLCLVATDLSEVGRLLEAIRGRDEFLSIASHELKTPLTALLLHTDGLLRAGARDGDDLPGAVRDRLGAARRQVRRLAHLVNDLLDVSRIRSGQLDLKLEEVDLAAVVREAVERQHREALAAGCEVEVELDGPVTGRWDRSRLDQVVTNLLSNAVKYGKGKPIRVGAAFAPGGRARLWVADGGIGISPADHERIFQRFERAAVGPEYGGMGLGLWITREIVARMAGRISVESELGAGARFLVELPVSEAEADCPAA